MSFIRRLIFQLIIRAYDLWSYISEVPRVLADEDISYRDLFKKLEEEEVERLAFVAPHPINILKFSAHHLLTGLLANGYTVVVAVASENAAAWIRTEFPQVHIVPRKLSGRDFGVWKGLILDFLDSDRLKSKTKKLILANDSLYYNGESKNIIETLTNCCQSWACVYENFEYHYHAQSFFLVFGNNAITNPAFALFWKRYFPFSSRLHSIDFGEVGLSAALSKAIGLPFCMFSSANLLKKVLSLTCEEIISVVCTISAEVGVLEQYRGEITQLELLLGLRPYENGHVGNPKQISEQVIKNSLIMLLSKLSERHNPTHILGVLVNNLSMAPLKRDLAYCGTYQIADILRLARGYSEEELAAIAEDLRAKGLPVSLRGFRRILFNAGRI